MKITKRYFKISIRILCVIIPLFIFIIVSSIKDSRPLKIICIPKIIDESNDFWSALMEGANMAAEEYDVILTVIAPDSEEEYEKQNQMILNAIEEKPDAIVLAPADYTETTMIAEKIKQQGIKLILIDSAMNEPIEDTIIATDNFQAGVKMGKLMKEMIQEGSSIAIVSHVKGSSTAIERENGLRYALGEDKERIVTVVYCDSDYEKAYHLTLQLLEEYPEVDIVAGLNEYSAVGAARAIKEKGAQDTIRVVGFDNSSEEIQLLEEGVFEGIVVQKSFNMGYLGVETAVKVIKGERIPPKIDSGSELITKENMYTEENQKLLFPFWGNQPNTETE